MNANHIESKFAMMGARFKVSVAPAQGGSNDYAVDIQQDRRGQFFELHVPQRLRDSLEVNVLQTDKLGRHLLLFVRPPEGKAARFLCGHNEREWFVAAVPGGASSVLQAKEALKPIAVRARQNLLKVPTRLRNRRKNTAFRRQGEWFFVPASAWGRDPINEKFVLHNEPLRRGAGKAHLVEQLYRVAGELVYVCPNTRTALAKPGIAASCSKIVMLRSGAGRPCGAILAFTRGAGSAIPTTPRSRCRTGIGSS